MHDDDEKSKDTPLMRRIRMNCVECGDCLLWQGWRNGSNVPMIGVGGRDLNVRRVWLEEKAGKPLGEKHAAACRLDSRCVSHAVALTRTEAARRTTAWSMHQRRPSRCAKIAAAKSYTRALTPEQVADVKTSKDSLNTLAKRHNVSKKTVLNVRQGKCYKDYSSPFAGIVGALA